MENNSQIIAISSKKFQVSKDCMFGKIVSLNLSFDYRYILNIIKLHGHTESVSNLRYYSRSSRYHIHKNNRLALKLKVLISGFQKKSKKLLYFTSFVRSINNNYSQIEAVKDGSEYFKCILSVPSFWVPVSYSLILFWF